MKNGKKNQVVIKIILIFVTLVYGLACAWLYYKQTFHVEGQLYESDLPYHISMAVEDNWFYSLTAVVYQLFYKTPFGNVLVAVFLASVTVGTIYATWVLLKELQSGEYGMLTAPVFKNENMLLFLAIGLNLVMPFFVSAAHYQRYIGYQSPTIWHNSTYICMKLLGILALILYFRLWKGYEKTLNLRTFTGLALALIVANTIKPSFVMVFAPAMAVFLVFDLMIHKIRFGKIILFGLTVIPSLFVILWQNMVLFGEDTGNGIALDYGYTLTLHSLHPKATLLLSIAFPIFVLLLSFQNLWRDRLYLFGWTMWGFGLLEVTFFNETGKRARDGNFLWGYSFAIFFLFTVSLLIWMKGLLEKKGMLKNPFIWWTQLILGTGILGYQIYCGIVFFTKLLQGTSYWM